MLFAVISSYGEEDLVSILMVFHLPMRRQAPPKIVNISPFFTVAGAFIKGINQNVVINTNFSWLRICFHLANV
ncbi:hypothetical protein OUZ56_002456 [Daphnia magna]|uniref:Uncharacterized protein n=1 Tax=Daphnia magna TaxID=35525 RepID=A0ABR0A663_9CRUS|nr:hypothetical protein OUZ56_002456 [Daphnia magna]